MIQLNELVSYCDELLQTQQVKDYCPNGLQVESQQVVKKIVTGVTASQALIECAIDEQADTLLVHHGYFWRNESAVLTGMKGKRIRTLLQNNMNLLAWHLPLDKHIEYGNNRQLANILKLNNPQPFDAEHLLWQAELEKSLSAEQFSHLISKQLNRQPLHISGGSKHIKKVMWCTGAAQHMIDQAIDAKADAFISGEISESTTHIAIEMGIHYFAAGHHATERYGVIALADHLAEKFEIEVIHIDIDNPV